MTTFSTFTDDALGTDDVVGLLRRLAAKEVTVAELTAAAIARAREAKEPDVVVIHGVLNGPEDPPGEIHVDGVLHVGAVHADGADVAILGNEDDIGHWWYSRAQAAQWAKV